MRKTLLVTLLSLSLFSLSCDDNSGFEASDIIGLYEGSYIDRDIFFTASISTPSGTTGDVRIDALWTPGSISRNFAIADIDGSDLIFTTSSFPNGTNFFGEGRIISNNEIEIRYSVGGVSTTMTLNRDPNRDIPE